MYELVDALRTRKSSRAIDPRPVEPEKIDALVEAFRWSPSSHNKQPWRLLIAESEAIRTAWDAALDPLNQLWAPRAPVKMTVIGHPHEQEAWHGQPSFLIDCGLAVQSLLVQACAMGLSVRALIGWDEQKVRTAHGIPDPFRVVALIAAGYPCPVGDLPESVQQKERRPRTRKAREEIFYRDRMS
jgi:nitroreductase